MSVSLDVRWIADYRTPHLSVQYCPMIEGLEGRDQETLHTSTPLLRPPPDQIRGDLVLLERLALAAVPDDKPDLEDIPWEKVAHTLERDVAGSYIHCPSEGWLTFNYQFSHALGGYSNRKRNWLQGDLDGGMTKLVERVDEYCCAHAQEHWSLRYNELATNHKTERFVPPPLNVFLSYRAERGDVLELVSGVHDNLSGPGAASFFKVFHDKRDLGSGTWKERLGEELAETHVFLPFLSNDYEEGEIARWELETSLARRQESGVPEIVPILVEGEWNRHPAVADFQGIRLPLESDPGLFQDQVGRMRALIVDAEARRA